ncbi:2-amino-4-hydroxy-6-hydroxymethyldihydropteridine diphosphokinase [Gordonia terrae]|uniref:2-amino-4-hydroxy-6-hydroxymethyldihydropteridine diphosphokinase n=2 Tax=Gordonia terrae TaxID=2055 RepID=A0AAD0NYV4_9ACTN|nr:MULTISPECIES: 2-amino-4-hydroxy-6-hydroxymethyldihydropteridine diphosphokinase [Gordonia]ANY24893.1 2-amino-4-hydroxy-6-hydroxymethyldihydropteridine diphosphokinase [Gordonia terrae]AWO85642.1 2-amino-4-hydroxy-6-hydroxymethyldihydropteridine diphosphokinase [Gordonia terrae]GAB43956.1 2-amino-4-hydroxy-6-hydroxymethyldihydropteridine pyrophosphokinase [Gordonia terrae NBRC 100016]VTS60736.1 Bifunctional folate synthesis protein [Gordonia terrae]
MSRAVLSAGSNVGDPMAYLRSVVEGFADELIAVSAVYSTPPWGGVEQDDFRNITLVVEGPHDARHWLERGFELERAAERTRDIRWGPRTLDVDVITVTDAGGVVVADDPDLTLPHPRAAQRAFVLVPWLEIEPAATLWTPAGVRAVAGLVAGLDATERDAVRAVGRLTGADS